MRAVVLRGGRPGIRETDDGAIRVTGRLGRKVFGGDRIEPVKRPENGGSNA